MNDKLLVKIRNLLARADEHRNDNEHERNIALRQAELLMAKHAISHIDLSENEQREIIGALTDKLFDRESRDLWPVSVMTQLSQLYRCRVIKLGGRRLHLFGHKTNIAILESMTAYCVSSIRREMHYAYKYQPGLKPNRRRFNTSFGNGACNGIGQQVAKLIEQRDRGEIAEMDQSTALTIVDLYKQQQLQVNNHLRDIYPRLSNARRSRSTSAAGHYAGKRFGESIHLGGQLGSKPPAGRLS